MGCYCNKYLYVIIDIVCTCVSHRFNRGNYTTDKAEHHIFLFLIKKKLFKNFYKICNMQIFPTILYTTFQRPSVVQKFQVNAN